jgi:hypothetical protein
MSTDNVQSNIKQYSNRRIPEVLRRKLTEIETSENNILIQTTHA